MISTATMKRFLQHILTLLKKATYIQQQSKGSLLLMLLLSTLYYVIISICRHSEHSSNPTQALADLMKGTLCIQNHCPSIFYSENNTGNIEWGTKVIQSIKTQNGRGFQKFEKLPNLTSLVDFYLQRDFKSNFGGPRNYDLYVTFNNFLENNTEKLAFTVFPSKKVATFEENVQLSRFYSLLYATLIKINSGNYSESLSIFLEKTVNGSQQSNFMDRIDWFYFYQSFIPLFFVVARRVLKERETGVQNLLRQLLVSDSVYLASYFIFHSFLVIIASAFVTTISFIIGKNSTPFSSISYAHFFLINASFGLTNIAFGLFIGFFSGSSYTAIFYIFLFPLQSTLAEFSIFIQTQILFLDTFFRILFPVYNFNSLIHSLSKSFLKSEPELNIYYTSVSKSIVFYLILAWLWKKKKDLGISSIWKNFLSSNIDNQESTSLAVRLIEKEFDGKCVLSSVTFDAMSGNVYTILGHNGAGKSTLMKIMAGLEQAKSGDIVLCGQEMSKNPNQFKSMVSYCAQENVFWNQLTGFQQVLLLLELSNLRKIDNEEVLEFLNELGLKEVAFTHVWKYSGGMKRRLSLALSAIKKSKLILLDEPTTGVDPVTRLRIWKFILKMKESAIVLLTTHSMEEAKLLSDNILFLHNGKVEASGTLKSISTFTDTNILLTISYKNSHESEQLKTALTENGIYFTYQYSEKKFNIRATEGELSEYFKVIKQLENSFQFQWSVVSLPLQEVFERLCPLNRNSACNTDSEIDFDNLPKVIFTLNDQLPSLSSKSVSEILVNQILWIIRKNWIFWKQDNILKISVFTIFAIISYFTYYGRIVQTNTNWHKSLQINLQKHSEMDWGDRFFLTVPNNSSAYLQLAENSKFQLMKSKKEIVDYVSTPEFTYMHYPYIGVQIDSFVNGEELKIQIMSEPKSPSPYQIIKVINWAYSRISKNQMELMGKDGQGFFTWLFAYCPEPQIYNGIFALLPLSFLLGARLFLHEKKNGITAMLRMKGLTAFPLWLGTMTSLLLFSTFNSFAYIMITQFNSSMFLLSMHVLLFLVSSIFTLWCISLAFMIAISVERLSSFAIVSFIVFHTREILGGIRNTPIVFLNPFGLFYRTGTSILANNTSFSNTYFPILVLCFHTIALFALSIWMEERYYKKIDMRNHYHYQNLELECKGDNGLFVTKVDKIYDQKKVLSQISLNVLQGECLGLLGPNGAGKTTLSNIILGLINPTNGSVIINSGRKNESSGYCPQTNSLWEELTIKDHLRIVIGTKGFSSEECDILSANIAKNIGLYHCYDQMAKELSGGMKRRLSIGMALAGSPTLIIFDEPTTGVDILHKKEIWKLFKNQEESAILLTTHDMEEASCVADKIAILNEGVMECLSSNADLKNDFGKGLTAIVTLSNTKEQHHRELSNFINEMEHIGIGVISHQRLVSKMSNGTNNQIVAERLFLSKRNFSLDKFFSVIRQFELLDWSLNNTSVEDIFVNIISKKNK